MSTLLAVVDGQSARAGIDEAFARDLGAWLPCRVQVFRVDGPGRLARSRVALVGAVRTLLRDGHGEAPPILWFIGDETRQQRWLWALIVAGLRPRVRVVVHVRAPCVPVDPALADLFQLADLIVTESDFGARAVRRCCRDRGAEAGGPVVSMPPLVPARVRVQDGTVRRDAVRAMAGATSGDLLIASGGATTAVTLRAMAVFQVFADGSYRACGGCHRVTPFTSRGACERSPVPVCGACGSTESRVGRPRPEARLFVAHSAPAGASASPLGAWSAEHASRLLGLEGRAHVETDAGVEPRHTLAHALSRLAAADIHLAPHDLSDLDSTVLASCALGVPTVTTRFGAAAEILPGVARLVPPAITLDASEGHRLAIMDIGGAVRELRDLADDAEALRETGARAREAMHRIDPAAVAARWHALLVPLALA